MLYKFQDLPGKFSAPGNIGNPLTNIRPMIPPPEQGDHRQLLNALGYPFSGFADAPFRTTRISRTWAELRAAGLFSALDLACFRTGATAGSLIDFVPGGAAAAVVSGGGVIYDHGIKTVAANSSFLTLYGGSQPIRSQYSLNSACVWAWLEDAGAANTHSDTFLFGNSGGTNLRLAPWFGGSSGSNAIGRINGTSQVVGSRSGLARTGFWLLQRVSATRVELYHNDDLIASSDANPSTAISDQIWLGRNAATYNDWGLSSFGFGRALNADERAALLRIARGHRNVVTS
ncbi:hypothetical protein [Devosia sp. 2618]|uniref:hypothetical protein n=1 Tax=Devosia sp. 2618 TaxID=3156454 RepID=UPI003394C239